MAPNKSLEIIKEEHRAVAAMLTGMYTIVDGIEAGRLKPDFDLLASMIQYIDEVPEVVHHPKEDQFLFSRLRLCSTDAKPFIEQLEQDHSQGKTRIEALRKALESYRKNVEGGLLFFKDVLQIHMEQEWRHMNMEEDKIFPLAIQHLTEADWQTIEEAFVANGNPWEGASKKYAELFSRIVNLAPAPAGLGAS
jgi:hemerythrin-like domain-containing protein